MYFLPAVGWEKVIKIRRFSNGTTISLEKKAEFQRPLLRLGGKGCLCCIGKYDVKAL
ncbi:MAG: hypothetical protein LBR79_03200 [Oscillospiraceae bacterium]|nr:hypothetical protein [Oscillospiraceae bacterium]